VALPEEGRESGFGCLNSNHLAGPTLLKKLPPGDDFD